jgi:uncharacterized protein with FMN-binding domain
VKRISYWALSTLSACVLLYGFDASQRGGAGANTPATISGGTSDATSGNESGNGSGTSSNGSSSTGSGNGNGSDSSGGSSGSTTSAAKTVTGSVAQTQWGPVQVRLAVKNGSITQVTILQYPHDNGRDVEIADYALPILIQETIKAQSADIDMVSGATYTSEGYVESLQSALDQANL